MRRRWWVDCHRNNRSANYKLIRTSDTDDANKRSDLCGSFANGNYCGTDWTTMWTDHGRWQPFLRQIKFNLFSLSKCLTMRTGDNTVAGSWFVSPTKINERTPNNNGSKVCGSVHCVASSTMQISASFKYLKRYKKKKTYALLLPYTWMSGYSPNFIWLNIICPTSIWPTLVFGRSILILQEKERCSSSFG